MLEVFFKLLIAHSICDVFLQSERMEVRKTSRGGKKHWFYWMSAHSLLNGLGVWIATGVMVLGIVETLAHFSIDYLKSEKVYGVHVDQLLHLGTKLAWLTAILLLPTT